MTIRRYVLIVPDGAGDRHRISGRSPLAVASTPHMDFLARGGVSGIMQTLYRELPRESLVAQMGMLGWAPHQYYPGGRASCELRALGRVALQDGDLTFRANLVRMEGPVLASYNADFISTAEAAPVVVRLNRALGDEFPDFELHHSSDFRNILVVRGANLRPHHLRCPEPHESHGLTFRLDALVAAADASGSGVAARINAYVERVSHLLAGGPANALFPWSPSAPLRLPPFHANTGFAGRTAVVGAMDFLCGLAHAGAVDFYKVGNGRPDTSYDQKGATAVRLLKDGYELVVVHVNAPDEAAHMGDVPLKVRCIEALDAKVVGPVVEYFRARPAELGGVMVVPDHYTNSVPDVQALRRAEVHSTDPVPFALWNGGDRDGVKSFDEESAARGAYADAGLNHLDLLPLLLESSRAGARRPSAEARTGAEQAACS